MQNLLRRFPALERLASLLFQQYELKPIRVTNSKRSHLPGDNY